MRTELVLFGRHFDVGSQARRRRLVVLVYAFFGVLMGACWFVDHWQVIGSWLIIFAASFVNRLVLGGLGDEGKGIVKPFLGNEVHARYEKDPDSRWSRLTRLTIPNVTDKREYLSDEREVRRRDGAHEVAYRVLGMVVIFTFLVAFLKNAVATLLQEFGTTVPTEFFNHLIYALLIVEFILFLSLPQSILLWTEPDVEEVQ